MSKSSFFFNPLNLPSETLIDNFVVRNDLMDKIFEIISSETDMLSTSKHFIIWGERGMGKTTLLARLKYKIEGDSILNQKIIPIIFTEEQPSVTKLSKFWELLLMNITEYTNQNNIVIAKKIDDWYEERNKKKQFSEKAFAEYIYDLIIENSELQGKKIILFIDNFHTILETLNEQEQRRLKEILMTTHCLQIVGASPAVTSRDNYSFLDFFQHENLDLLNDIEGLKLLKHYARNNHPTLRLLEDEPHRVEIIRRVTGGNIRSLLMFYELLDNDKGIDAYEKLYEMLDKQTDFYNKRIKDLGIEKQAIIDVIAFAWDGIKVKEIAKILRQESNVVSAHLKQLVVANIINEHYTILKEGGKRTQVIYLLSDRLMNMWYLMRYGKQDTKNRIIRFLKMLEAWVSKEQFVKMKSDLFDGLKNLNIGEINATTIREILKSLNPSNEEYISNKVPPPPPVTIGASSGFNKHLDILNMQGFSEKLQRVLYESILSIPEKEILIKVYRNNQNEQNILSALQQRNAQIAIFAKEQFQEYIVDDEVLSSQNICIAYFSIDTFDYEMADIYLQNAKNAISDTSKIGEQIMNLKLIEKLGSAYIKLAEKDEIHAENYYQKALDVGFNEAYLKRGLYYERNRKDYKKAFEDYFQALRKISHPNVNIAFRLGYVAEHYLKDYEKAIYFYKSSSEKQSQCNLGWVYHKRGDNDRAIDIMKKIYENDKNDSKISRALGRFHYSKYELTKNSQDWKEAERYYLIGVDKEDPDSMNGLAYIYYELCLSDKKEVALGWMQKLYERNQLGNNSYMWHTYGTILLWNGKVEESKKITTDNFLYNTELMEEEYKGFIEYLLLLCAIKEYDFVLDYFVGVKGESIQTKERFSAIYFVLMNLMGNEDEYERIRPELQEAVVEMLESVKEHRTKYCS